MLNLDYILKNKIKPIKYNFPAIYFLIKNDKIIYIGSTINLSVRLNNHKNNKRMFFDSFYFIKYSKDNLQEMRYYEYLYILKYKPKYNFKHNPDACDKRKILFSKYFKTYNSINEFSEIIGVSTTTLNKYFNNDEKLEHLTDRIEKVLFPNGIPQRFFNMKYDLRITDFKNSNQ